MFTHKHKLIAVLALLAVSSAQADPVPGRVEGTPFYIFSVEGETPNTVTAPLSTARSSFLSLFDNTVQSYDFENAIVGATSPLAVGFAGSAGTTITATLNGSTGSQVMGSAESGRFNTTPNPVGGGTSENYWRVNSTVGGTFTITFTRAISAFGFYGTDIGDFGGVLKLVLDPLDNNLPDEELIVRPQTQMNAVTGLPLFYAFADSNKQYRSVSFESTGTGNPTITDYFGFDDFIVADSGQFRNPTPLPNPTPEPGSLALAGLALLAAGWARRARRVA